MEEYELRQIGSCSLTQSVLNEIDSDWIALF